MDIFDIFALSFMQRAFIAALLLSVLFSCFGTFIVPRRLGFMADGISHASLLGIAAGIVIGVYPMILAITIAAFFGFLLARITDHGRITQDGLVGVFLCGGMAGAIILMSLVPGYKPELFSYLFGDILSIRWLEIYGLCVFFIVTLILFFLQWRSLVITTVHTDLSHVIHMPVRRTRYFLFIGTSVALIAGVKLLGVILVSALLIIPVLTANQLGKSLKSTILFTQAIAILAAFFGIVVSYILDIPSGPSIALLLVIVFVIVWIYSSLKSRGIQ